MPRTSTSQPRPAPTGNQAAELAARLSHDVQGALERGDLELPPLRQSVVQVLELCNRQEFEVQEVVDVVHTDAALAGHLLRLANSAAFGAKQRIDSITEAVSRLGARQLQGIAAGMMLKADLFKGSVRIGTRLRRMWQHSALAGMYARDIGPMANLEPRAAMLIGLMHNVGAPFVLRQVLDLETTTGTSIDDQVVDAVVAAVHAPIGAALVRAWGLSDALAAAAEFHHDWSAAKEHIPAVLLAHVADQFAQWAASPSAAGGQAILALPLWSELNVPLEKIGGLFRAHESVKQMAQSL